MMPAAGALGGRARVVSCDEWRRRVGRRVRARREHGARQPIASVVPALGIGAGLSRLWVRAGRPRGVAEVVAEAEHEES
jgi:hypothetical protein